MNGITRVAFLALALTTVLASSAAAGDHPRAHNGWSIGIGLGGGSAGLNFDNDTSSDREGGGMGNFRVGYPLTQELALQLESSGWVKSENDVTVSFNATTIGLACFTSSGIVLRGGVGVGNSKVAVDIGSTTVTNSETGFGANAAVGYEFRVARTFSIDPQADFGYTTFDGGSANWFGGSVQFNWYFVPKN